MALNLPPSWDRMTDHGKACYLIDSHQALDYADARKKVWRRAREARRKAKVTVAAYQATLEKRGLA